MNKLSLMIAWRYLIGTKHEKNISTMVLICFLGILIGSFALALVAAVMNGFEKVTHEKMQSIHAQIIAHADNQPLNFKKIKDVLQKEFQTIKSIAPSTTKQIIAQADEKEGYNLVSLTGVDPHAAQDVSNINSKIKTSISPQRSIASILQKKTVLIGDLLAKNMKVSIGDEIHLFFSSDEKIKRKKIRLDQEPVIVGGTFKTGIDEFDNGLIICSLDLIQKMFPDIGITQIGIKLKDNANEKKTIARLKKRLKHLDVFSWKELYPALVEALQLEKYAMFLILALIILVASMSIISLLFMQINQKRADIAILRAMGMPSKHISQVFLYVGMSIAIIGSTVGLALATLAGWFLEKYPLIKLPDVYYVTHLPCKMDFSIIVAVFIVVLALSFLSTWIPTRRIRSIYISHVLRFEG